MESSETTWLALRARLEARQTRIVEAIRDYPPPITACDAQFDHLLEQRDGISRELRRLEDARKEKGASGKVIAAFVASSNWIEGDAAPPPAHTDTSKRIAT